jgi:hypothetical protein
MVHDELQDFATPYSIVHRYNDDERVYDNEQFNDESSDSDDCEMDYNYGDEYFY